MYRYYVAQGSYEDYHKHEILHENKFTEEEFLHMCKEVFRKLSRKKRQEVKYTDETGDIIESLMRDYKFVLPEEEHCVVHVCQLYYK